MFSKKVLALLLTLSLVVSVLLTGCGGSQPQSSAPAKSSAPAASAPASSAPAQSSAPVASNVDWSKYPERAITDVIAYAPGGGSDTMYNAIAPFVQKQLKGLTFANEYKAGANGGVGWTYVNQNTKADGYTVTISCTPSIMANVALNPKETGYTMDDFVPIYNVVEDPGVLVVKADSPLKTFKDFIDYAKKNPKSVTVGNSGVGGDDWAATMIMQKSAGIELIAVPFSGDGPSWQAALGGHVVASSNNVSIVFEQIKAGKLRALVVYGEKRSEFLPDVPTAKEQGINLISGSGRGFSAKKGTPEEALKILEAAFDKAMKDPEFLKKAKEIALPIAPMNREEYGKYLKQRDEDFKQVLKDAK